MVGELKTDHNKIPLVPTYNTDGGGTRLRVTGVIRDPVDDIDAIFLYGQC